MVSSLSFTNPDVPQLQLEDREEKWGELKDLIKPTFTLLELKQAKPFSWLFRSASVNPHQAVLHLTILFAEQRIPFEDEPDKFLGFGLRGLELRVRLSNGKMSYEKRAKGIGSLVLDDPGLGANKIEQHQNTVEVVPRGSDTSPVWSFQLDSEASVLKGKLDVDLGVVDITGYPLEMEATFRTSPMDVHLTMMGDLWTPGLTKNKLAVLERVVALRYVKPLLGNHLVKVRLHHDKQQTL